jgi:putative ABC transport system substrate-binding protein
VLGYVLLGVAVQQETQKIPIVFVTVADPIRAGFVASLPRPGGNLTGFVNLEISIAAGQLRQARTHQLKFPGCPPLVCFAG